MEDKDKLQISQDQLEDLFLAEDDRKAVSADVFGILCRLILSVFAGGMLGAGVKDEKFWDKFTAFGLIIAALSWSALQRRYRRRKRIKRLGRLIHSSKPIPKETTNADLAESGSQQPVENQPSP